MDTIQVSIIEPTVVRAQVLPTTIDAQLVPSGPAGPPGPEGPAGPAGPPGATTGDLNLAYEQLTASTEWNVPHTLSKKPSVTTVDSLGRHIHGSVTYISSTMIQITFLVANAGFVYLN